MNKLPFDIIEYVTGYMDMTSVIFFAQTCHEYNVLLNEEKEIWKRDVPNPLWNVVPIEGNHKIKWAIFREYQMLLKVNQKTRDRYRLNYIARQIRYLSHTNVLCVKEELDKTISFINMRANLIRKEVEEKHLLFANILREYKIAKDWLVKKKRGKRKHHNIFVFILQNIKNRTVITEKYMNDSIPYTSWKPNKNSKTNILMENKHINDDIPQVYLRLLEDLSKRCENIYYKSPNNWKIIWVNGELKIW